MSLYHSLENRLISIDLLKNSVNVNFLTSLIITAFSDSGFQKRHIINVVTKKINILHFT